MFEQVFFSGLALGSIYGLVALGFAVIFKATDVFNFAQGMFVVCGAYLAVTAISILQLPFALSIVFIVGAAALLGVLIHMALIQPLLGRPMPALKQRATGPMGRLGSTCWRKSPAQLCSSIRQRLDPRWPQGSNRRGV
jgi:branched-chain amino acid transport system permease protein